DIVINELGSIPDILEFTKPKTFIATSPAGALGFGLGGALGAKLATPDRNVFLTVGDGSYMFGNPVPAHFVAAAEKLPTLTIVANNRRWNAVHASTLGMYPEGRASKANTVPLVALEPTPQYDKVIEATGGYGQKVNAPDELLPAMERAMNKISDGVPALINVHSSANRAF
ncbi:MAG: decarboxylase, partial [Rhodospirillales bacterium]|nr:decarboxylase [Rhodospirillales bacterium]